MAVEMAEGVFLNKFSFCSLVQAKVFSVCFHQTVWLVANLLYLSIPKTIKSFSTQSNRLVAGLPLLFEPTAIFENVKFWLDLNLHGDKNAPAIWSYTT